MASKLAQPIEQYRANEIVLRSVLAKIFSKLKNLQTFAPYCVMHLLLVNKKECFRKKNHFYSLVKRVYYVNST